MRAPIGRRTRRALLTLTTVLVTVVLLTFATPSAIAAPAGDPPWTPGDDWFLVTSSVDESLEDAPGCGTAQQWRWQGPGAGGELTLWHAVCDDDDEAIGMAEWRGIPGRPVTGVAVLDDRERVRWNGADAELRWQWIASGADATTLVELRMPCPEDPRACAGQLAPYVLDLQDTLAGQGYDDVESPRYDVSDVLIQTIVFVWLVWIVFVGPFRLIAFLRRPRYRSGSTSPRYHDLTQVVMTARWKRRVRLFVWGLAGFLVLVELQAIVARDTGAAIGVLVALAVLVGIVALMYRFLPPHPVEDVRPARLGSLGARGGVGMALSTIAYGMLPVVLVIFVLLNWYAGASGGWPVSSADGLSGRWEPLAAPLYPIARAFAGDLQVWLVPVLLVVIALLVALDEFGRRIRAASVADALAQDTRPHYLYLRSFDEDSLKLPGLLRRRGLLGALSLFRQVRFEEVLVQQLSMSGPVIAIAPPGARIAPIGAARASFSNDEWQQHVARYAQTARAVILSATPKEVRQGFAWEIELVANYLQHRRVMVVLGPWKRSQIARRWATFIGAVGAIPFFSPIAGPWVPDGVTVLAHSERQGWQAWGSTRRTDWTYSVAIDAATRAYLPDWS
ncbi:hypothetical protein EXU48_19970 [Occultella glacieicola]|uniref:DUF2868 domain-containing protein n=1 Tax=Occultella glacieicola TaxID=2518684 RepID=A0ABY2E055_9MICO|nr:hypothetical protein [Occultella glacieicola]TDE89697.1 hypothetical protein EXU48_19970 [Occultella glacieicola]